MKQSISIRISAPCHEDWKEMTPADKGRFCNTCTKVVVDFTLMTNNELIAYFDNKKGEDTCGRFMSYQLNKPLEKFEMQYQVKSKWDGLKKIAAMLITGCSLLLASCNRRSDVTGKAIKEVMELDSQSVLLPNARDTVPVKAITPRSDKKNRATMGKTQVVKEVLTGEVEVIRPEIIQGITVLYSPEELPVETVDTLQNKK